MSRPSDPTPERTGEWDTPHLRRAASRTPSLASPSPGPSARRHHRQLVRSAPTPAPPRVLSGLRQQVLPEDEYLAALSHIIQRDFFPHLHTLEQRNHLLDAFDSRDPDRIAASVRSLRQLGATPTPRRPARAGATPLSVRPRPDDAAAGTTPADDLTPTYFDRTPLTSVSATPSRTPRLSGSTPLASAGVEPHISLDTFQARFTSEDNASFQDLLQTDNSLRRDKHAWAYAAEHRANARAVRGRQARERLVDLTRRMVESSGDGSVRLLDGVAGKPGETRLLVDAHVEVGADERYLLTGRDEAERLLIIDGKGSNPDSAFDQGKGKGKEVVLRVPDRVDESAQQYIDMDRPTVDEEEDNRPIPEQELQVKTAAWPFKTRNSLMFGPGADSSPASAGTDRTTLHATASSSSSSSARGKPEMPPVPLGEPKGVRHHATRLDAMDRGSSGGAGARNRSSLGGASEASLSPTRSRIGAAIAGTPYPAPPTSATPRVGGFSFVDALPTVASGSLPAQALQELMTWGTLEATPVTLREAEPLLVPGSGDGGSATTGAAGPFRVRPTDRREELAHKMARRAKRSLAEAGASPRTGLALGNGSGGGLRRSVVEGSLFRGAGGAGERTPHGGGGLDSSPRPRAEALSPAARTLLGRTKPGRALETGLGRTEAWGDAEDQRNSDRARTRAAREVESRDRLRRERWTPSPSVSLGGDPNRPSR